MTTPNPKSRREVKAMSDEELKLEVARLCRFTLVKAGTLIENPLVGMELVCGYCRAVIRCTERWNWNLHEHCGPHGCDCGGGEWKLFESVWTQSGKVKRIPDYPRDLNAMHEAENTLTFMQKNVQYYGHLCHASNASPTFATAQQRALAFVLTLT